MSPNRPGGPLHEKPIKLSAVDEKWSQAFWGAGQPNGMKSVMEEVILKVAGEEGTFSPFVGYDKEKKEYDEASKRKLSAYRALAFEHGILMSAFQLNERSGTATARMFRLHELTDKA